MSSAKRRGQARGNAPQGSADRGRGSRGPNPARGRVAPFDGPASRGSGSGAGSQSQVSGPPAASRRTSDVGSQAASQSAAQSTAQAAPMARDPAREGPAPRATDGIKNVDMPASFYNIDGQVSLHPLLASFFEQLLSSSEPVLVYANPALSSNAHIWSTCLRLVLHDFRQDYLYSSTSYTSLLPTFGTHC